MIKNKMNQNGFSLLELLVGMTLFTFITIGSFNLYIQYFNTAQSIAEKTRIQDLHNHFRYILSKTENCSATIAGLSNRQKVVINLADRKTGNAYEYDKFRELLDLGKSIQKGQQNKREIGIVSATLNINPIFFFKNYGYADIEISYIKKLSSGKKETKTKKIKVMAEVENSEGTYSAVSCLPLNSQTMCPHDVSFLASFNDSTFNTFTAYKPKENERDSGVEYTYRASNLFENNKGEYCVSHNICENGQWISRALCYDSCRNKFWWDGKVSYEDQSVLESDASEDEPTCKIKTFRFTSNSRCNGLEVPEITLPDGFFNEAKSYTQPIRKEITVIKDGVSVNREKTVAEVEVIFKCSYAGTWALKYAKCIKLSCADSACENKIPTPEWDIKLTRKTSSEPPTKQTLICPTNGKRVEVSSHDGTEKVTVKLGSLFPNRKFHIGDPRRLIINFKDKPSSATVVCKRDSSGNNRWKQIGDSISNCEGLNNPIPQVDILFVVDNSGSMGDNQIALGNSIGQFTNKFFSDVANTINYRILVVTTDFKVMGNYKKENYKNKESLLKSRLKIALKPPRRGSISDTERPIKAALKVLKDTSLNFYRRSAVLALLIITDEDWLFNDETVALGKLIKFINQSKTGNPSVKDTNKVVVRGVINLGGKAADKHVQRITRYYLGKVLNVDNRAGYGLGLADFSEEIVEKTLILGN